LADSVCLNLSSLFGECVYIQCFDCYLVSEFTNETHVYSPVTSNDAIETFFSIFMGSLPMFIHVLLLMMQLTHFSPSLWYHPTRKSRLKPLSAFYVHQRAFPEPILCKTCDSLA
jgi:hypothetical protein